MLGIEKELVKIEEGGRKNGGKLRNFDILEFDGRKYLRRRGWLIILNVVGRLNENEL